MTTEQHSAIDLAVLNQEARAIWNHNAAFWDERISPVLAVKMGVTP